MRIALAVDDNMITQHFGYCEYFVVYEVEDKQIKGSEILKNPPHQKGQLPKYLKENNIDVVITGNMGQMAVNLMANLGIECIRGVKGNLVDVINAYVEGTLESKDTVCNQHKHHGEH
ncbi:NifB/NifX family molybdenum-iron cluster-binding protein [Candidatus Izemoplasma sp. B36]|uniref:NifB/NifX family molybdenum-iron cluster-binding protein n=1 Tax=Candidatus Izemoplasma sp. B36 TaxID=3242468 RepID=UPI003558F987